MTADNDMTHKANQAIDCPLCTFYKAFLCAFSYAIGLTTFEVTESESTTFNKRVEHYFDKVLKEFPDKFDAFPMEVFKKQLAWALSCREEHKHDVLIDPLNLHGNEDTLN